MCWCLERCALLRSKQLTTNSLHLKLCWQECKRADDQAACQGESEAKQLGLFFFSEPDARALVEKVRRAAPFVGLDRVVTPGLLTMRDGTQIREQNPKLAKQTQVLKVTVDKASAALRPFCYVSLCTPD